MVRLYCHDYPPKGNNRVILSLSTNANDGNGMCGLPIPIIKGHNYDHRIIQQGNRTTEHQWSVCKSILSHHSPYFEAMFEHDFYESTASVICLPSSILNFHGISAVIFSMHHSCDPLTTTTKENKTGWLYDYYDLLSASTTASSTAPVTTTDHAALDKLYLLQDTYAAADYFGVNDVCIQVAGYLCDLVHQWACQCDDCLCIIPILCEFLDTKIKVFNSNTNKSNIDKRDNNNNSFNSSGDNSNGRSNGNSNKGACQYSALLSNIINSTYISKNATKDMQYDDHLYRLYAKAILSFTHDPEKCLATFWTHRAMARLLEQLPNDHSLILSRRLCRRISKSNAVESLHACFLATTKLSGLDPLLCWSRSLHATLASAQAKATQLIARHFEYYCSQYPALLSCIDGITYSFDFLEYLFMHILEDQMDMMNAGLLYQGLVRDLICRHAVQYHTQVKHILSVAKDIILQYMSTRLDQLTKLAALDTLETDTIKMLAIELDVPAKSLVHSLEKHQGLVQQSLLTILFPPPKISYPSSSSASINMSRRSSMTTQRTLSLQSNATSTYSVNSRRLHQQSSSSPSFVQKVKIWLGSNEANSSERRHAKTFSSLSSMSSSASAPSPASTANKASSSKSTLFSWATVPVRSPKKKKGILYRILHSEALLSKQAQRKSMTVVVGKRVQLTRRPVLTVGTVKYVGTVAFAEGIWVGVELDRRVGKNDGSYENIRYFDSTPNRGVFVRSDDLKVMF